MGSRIACDAIEKSAVNARQWAIIVLLTLALVLDGLDVKILSFAAPLILKDWDISTAAFGPVLAAALVGMALGAWFGGRGGDRWGRRIVIVASLALFGVTTILAGMVQGVFAMTAMRFLSGLGFGAVTPNAYALVSEWLPKRVKPVAIALLTIGSPLGGSVGAIAALWLLPQVGWQGCFIVAGAITLGLAATASWLPESPAFLALKGRPDKACWQWRRVFPGGTSLTFQSEAAAAIGASAVPEPTAALTIWRRGHLRMNAGSVLCFFSTHFVNYAIATWGTVILTTAGVPLAEAITGFFFYNILAVLFGFATGPVLRLAGSKTLLSGNGLALLMLIAGMAYCLDIKGAHETVPATFIVLGLFALAGGVSGSLITVIAAIATIAYPDGLRATGVGLGITAGRVGGIASILVGGELLSLGHGSPLLLLALLAVLALCVVTSAFVIDRHSGRPQVR